MPADPAAAQSPLADLLTRSPRVTAWLDRLAAGDRGTATPPPPKVRGNARREKVIPANTGS
ncbi:MAG TPA: hypothetical protein VFG68_05525 [Fimbriiglobus sp.]|nr:hypothetical protein [Fimbriiglobus sp.]